MRIVFPRKHIFYDEDTATGWAEVVLALADVLVLFAATMLATALLHRPGGAIESLLILVWIAIPRALARGLAWIERPREPLKLYGLSAALIIGVSLLIAAGWDVIFSVNARYVPMGIGTAAVIILAWCSTLFLFHPGSYRLYDFLCGAVVLLGLLERKPMAWLWVPVYFLALASSAASRHYLRDVADPLGLRRVNLQNTRVLAVGGALLASLLFFGSYALFHGGLRFPTVDDLFSRPYNPGLVIHLDFGESRQPQWERTQSLQKSTESTAQMGQVDPFSYRIPIASDNWVADDPAVAWLVRPAGETESWPPPASSLWRGATFSTFRPLTQTWEETAPLVDVDWPSSDTLEVPRELPERTRELPALDLEYEVRIPIFQSLVALERATSFRSSGVTSARRSDAWDVLPEPDLTEGTSYRATSRRLAANEIPVDPPILGSHDDRERFLQVPDPDELGGYDLRQAAREIFQRHAGVTILERLAQLREFYRNENFLYHREARWRRDTNQFGNFLRRGKIGNCTHYATTAALLLRAGGVSTRFCVGFLGGFQREDSEEIELRVSMAHAWVEVYFPEVGWLPVDPTAWVPPVGDPNAVLDEGNLPMDDSQLYDGQALSEVVREPGAGSTARIPDPADTSTPLPYSRDEDTTGDGDAPTEVTRRERSYGNWFEYGRRERPAPAGAGPGRHEGARMGPVRERFDTGERLDYRSYRQRYMDGEEDATQTATIRGWRRVLRIVVIALAVVVLIGLPVAYRLARKRQREQEELEAEGAEEEAAALGIAASDLVASDGTPRGAIIGSYHRLQRDLARTRNHRLAAQTPREHGERLGRRFSDLVEPLHSIVAILYRALYSRERVDEDDAKQHEDDCRRVRRELS